MTMATASDTGGEPTTRGLKRSVQCAAAACALLAYAGVASAQVPYPGYTFAEVADEAGKPVSGAATVVYDETGEEIRSSVTDSEGKSPLIENGRQQKRFIVRVIKRGYLTYEGEFKTAGAQYVNTEIKIKLTSLSRPKSKAVDKRRAASPSKRARTPAGPSPPPNSHRTRAANRAAPSRVLRGPPT